MRWIFGYDREISLWVGKHLECDDFGQCSAIGLEDQGKIICGVVYHNFRWPNIEMSIYSTTPKWASRYRLKGFYDYPFNQLNCSRVTVLIDPWNQSLKTFLKRIGHKHEGTIRKALPNGDDLEIWGLLREECKYLRNPHGEEIQPKSAACA